MKFVDYESSHITPQMTLLKKFNEVLKYLREIEPHNIRFYLHKIIFTYHGTTIMYLISTSKIDLTLPIARAEDIPQILFNVSPFMNNYFLSLSGAAPNLYIKVKDSSNVVYDIRSDEIEEI